MQCNKQVNSVYLSVTIALKCTYFTKHLYLVVLSKYLYLFAESIFIKRVKEFFNYIDFFCHFF